jgi:hypothetical protein
VLLIAADQQLNPTPGNGLRRGVPRIIYFKMESGKEYATVRRRKESVMKPHAPDCTSSKAFLTARN